MRLVLPFLLVVVGVAVVVAVRRLGTAATEQVLKRAALVLMAVLSGFFGVFAVGEALADPGGLAAVGLIALWAVPLVALGALAWRRPHTAAWVLGAMAALVVAVSTWAAVATDSWRSFEDDHGPIRTIASFVVAAALTLLAWKRTVLGGSLLVAIGLLPVLLGAGLGGGGLALGSLVAVSVPSTVAGILYLLSARAARQSRRTTRPARPAATAVGGSGGP